MVSALHLLWIIPLSAGVGMFIASLLTAAGRADDASDDTKRVKENS